MDMVVLVSILSLLMGGFLFCAMREHLLNSLLSLEFMVLSVFILLVMMMGSSGSYYSLIYLIITACEGALGLSLLIIMSRSYGGDYFKGLGLSIF